MLACRMVRSGPAHAARTLAVWQVVLMTPAPNTQANGGRASSSGSSSWSVLPGVPLVGDALEALATRQLQERGRDDGGVLRHEQRRAVAGILGGAISVEAFLEQAEQYNEALRKASPAVRTSFGAANAPRTHDVGLAAQGEHVLEALGRCVCGMERFCR